VYKFKIILIQLIYNKNIVIKIIQIIFRINKYKIKINNQVLMIENIIMLNIKIIKIIIKLIKVTILKYLHLHRIIYKISIIFNSNVHNMFNHISNIYTII
jgi:hypothetical protein